MEAKEKKGDKMKATQLREPRSGITTATTSASPITKIGNTSTAATTTYTTTTVADATAWNLSALTAGQIALGIWAVTTEGYRGRVTAVNDTTDTVTIAGGWITPEGNQLDPSIATKKPTNATAVTFHRVSYCKSITITGYAANTVTVYSGFNSSLPSDGTDGEEINANISKVYTGNIDATKLYIICASSSPKVSWIASDAVGGSVAGGSSASYSGTVDLASDVTGVLDEANGGTGLSSYTQGDIVYASASTTIAKLAKDANATRYLSNTGTNNNPAWAQVALATGVSGTLPVANGGTGSAVGNVVADSTPDTDHSITGATIFPMVAHENMAFGDICYVNADGECAIADADAEATARAFFVCADATIAADATGNFAFIPNGFIIRDDTWNWSTKGAWVYLSTDGTTGNTWTTTAPSGTDDTTVHLGIVLTANIIAVGHLLIIEHQ